MFFSQHYHGNNREIPHTSTTPHITSQHSNPSTSQPPTTPQNQSTKLYSYHLATSHIPIDQQVPSHLVTSQRITSPKHSQRITSPKQHTSLHSPSSKHPHTSLHSPSSKHRHTSLHSSSTTSLHSPSSKHPQTSLHSPYSSYRYLQTEGPGLASQAGILRQNSELNLNSSLTYLQIPQNDDSDKVGARKTLKFLYDIP